MSTLTLATYELAVFMDNQNPTKKCPECQSDVSVLAKKCPNCRSKISASSQKTKSVLIGIILISFFVSLMAIGAAGDPAPSTTVATDPTNYSWIYAEDYIKEILKSPSTADFCRASTRKISETQYKVTSCVDSQNGFGAMIRSEWEADMAYLGSNPESPTSWYPKKIIFDGEVVYEN